jgi:hypothetical protein
MAVCGQKYAAPVGQGDGEVAGTAARLALFRLNEGSNNKPERKYVLMKAADTMVDSVRIHKNAFRLADMRSSKVQQSRYERRKIRAFLRFGDWLAEA